ncbi:efflux RND transporter periplasmic adaptor subunit [Polyangium jinanense]|uniref:Efflux RND transporter periplasmic adaptor subunit n=1 Tax=Polyangium jinanense TaxID=2829994 RepID=A0A9X3XAK1_9BACT|nr:efflux RND transporter periplasmic adaptor subunit [Polyangium jinanense]MDC3957186.1 efflux RND transporter periplasmic adaptor subunit [Polyangium jinanense]MDC3986657.1 efflux RND transporter periplasmic adaptor subunit [Polyangium jinanense]
MRARSIGFVVAALILLAACARPEAAPEPAADVGPKSAETPWVAARAPGGLSLLEAPAELVPPAGAKGAVVPPFSARITKVHVEHGERVEEGAPIADVVMPELARAAGAFAAAGTRIGAHGKRKAQLEDLRKDGLAKLAEIAEVEGVLADASGAQQMALATLKIAGLGPKDVASLVSSGGLVTLKSPVAGVVTELDAALGESREPTGAPIARIEGAGAARVEARFSQRPPPGARFVFVAPLGQTTALTLLSEAPSTNGRDGTVAAWFKPAEVISLPHGTLGKVRVSPDPGGTAVAIPAAAVTLKDGVAVVLSRKTGAPLPVKVLSSSGADALVEGDLRPGDEVAADASRALPTAGGDVD